MLSPKVRRWSVLFLVSVVMMTGYIFWDILSPVSTTLMAPAAEGGLGWSAAEYGFYVGSYTVFNIFLLMLFFGGIILDRCGIRLTGLLSTGAMLLGAVINWGAFCHLTPTSTVDLPFTFFGFIPSPIKTQVLIASLGFGIFGMGCDITGITISKIITKWFTGYELASAMGTQLAIARLATAASLSFAPLLAQIGGIRILTVIGAAILLVGFLLFVIYCVADKSYDKNCRHTVIREGQPTAGNSLRQKEDKRQDGPSADGSGEDSFSFHDFLAVLRNPGFWLIVFICVFYYASIRTFMKFASDLMVQQYDVSKTTAGLYVSIIPYGAIVLTPFFGWLYDRIGHGVMIMLVGCLGVVIGEGVLAIPSLHSQWIAFSMMILIGIAFSLVPSALWPSVPKIVPLRQLGTAYSIIYYIQNIGLMLTPIAIGQVIDSHTSADGTVSYTAALTLFATLGLLSAVCSLLLLITDHKKEYALERKPTL